MYAMSLLSALNQSRGSSHHFRYIHPSLVKLLLAHASRGALQSSSGLFLATPFITVVRVAECHLPRRVNVGLLTFSVSPSSDRIGATTRNASTSFSSLDFSSSF